LSTSDKLPLLDRFCDAIVRAYSPERAAKRDYFRQIADTHRVASPYASYGGSVQTRLDRPYGASFLATGRRELNRTALADMRNRSRQLVRNNPLAKGMLDRCVENVIGPGLAVQAKTSDDGWNKDAEDGFTNFLDAADVRGMLSGVDFQKMALRCALRDGDAGIVLGERSDGTPSLQLVEGDNIDDAYMIKADGPATVHGIELDADQRPTRFHVVTLNENYQRVDTPVKARDFIFLPLLTSQSEIRGEPIYAQCLPLFDQLDGYIDASVVAARIGASQALIFKQNNASQRIKGMADTTNAAGNTQKKLTIEPGMMHFLDKPDHDVISFDPKQPTTQFSDFTVMLLRIIGSPVGLPLELLLLDFSRTSYASARASLIQAYRTFRGHQRWFRDRVMKRTYQWYLSKEVKAGRMRPPAAIADTYWQHGWRLPGWQMLDMSKEIPAALLAIDAGIESRTNWCAQHGVDWEEDVAAVAQSEQNTMRDYGMSIVHSAQTRDPMTTTNPQNVGVSGNPLNPATPPDDGDDDAQDS
jgi:lambda family phage portal protein